MTSLLEKALITGFGIFTLILFLIIINPFIREIKNYEKSQENQEDNSNDTNDLIEIINKVDFSIIHFIEQSQKLCSEKIKFVHQLPLIFKSDHAIFNLNLENKESTK